MSLKSKGTNAERELLHLFWQHGWPCIRAAGSGSMRHPSPDLLVGNITAGVALAIECKTTKFDHVYLTKKEVDELRQFAAAFGAMPFIAVRFRDWFFVTPEDLEEKDSSYAVSYALAQRRGLSVQELITFLQDMKKQP